MNMDDFVSFVRQVFDMPEGQIILHDPRFIGNERKYLSLIIQEQNMLLLQ